MTTCNYTILNVGEWCSKDHIASLLYESRFMIASNEAKKKQRLLSELFASSTIRKSTVSQAGITAIAQSYLRSM